MKCLFNIVCVLIFSFETQAQIEDKIYREGHLKELLENIDTDEKLQFERKCAYHFHHLINEYRVQKRLHTLYWDDRLWLAARNHNLYMIKSGGLTHGESRNHESFTGGSPGERIQYSCYGAALTGVFGENILYNYAHDIEGSLDDIAYHMAKESFEDWKNSKPHNENMLDAAYFAHGTAFNVENTNWGTSVFIGKPKSYVEKEIQLNGDVALHEAYPPLFEMNGEEYHKQDFDEALIEAKLYLALANEMKLKSFNKNEIAMKSSRMHMVYMLQNGQVNLEEKKGMPQYFKSNTKKRFIKSGHVKALLKLMGHALEEIVFEFKTTRADLISGRAMEILITKIEKSALPPASTVEWGGIVQLIEKNNDYYCIADLLYLVEK
ncbi:MAG: CAP domain-containing protein [Crocinitomicaceae bacterium]